jgi:hypothetical protein
MVKSTIYKGIEFIRISSLPADQQAAMKENFDTELFIKILINETVVSDCVQYKDYSAWYASNFSKDRVGQGKKLVSAEHRELVEEF